MKFDFYKNPKKTIILYFLVFLCLAIPISTYLLSTKTPSLPEMFPAYPPTPTPTPTPPPVPGETINIKANFEGLSTGSIYKKSAVIASEGDWSEDVVLDATGSGQLDISGLDKTQTYDFAFYSHPYLVIKENIDLSLDPLEIDFGQLLTGDLNADNKVNTIDWSFIRLNYDKTGENFSD